MGFFAQHKWVIPVGIAAVVLLLFLASFGGFGVLSSANYLPSDRGAYHSSVNSASLNIEIPPRTLMDVRQSVRDYLQSMPAVELTSEQATINERTANVNFVFTVPVERSDNVIHELRSYGKVTSFSQSTRPLSEYDQRQGNTGNPEVVTVSLRITERKGVFAGLSGLSMSRLVGMFFSSINALIWFVSATLPWLIFGILIWAGVRFYNNRRRPPSEPSQGQAL